MLDALKKLTGGSRTDKQAQDLKALILSAKEERRSLNVMLEQWTRSGSKLAEVGKTLKQFDAQTVATDRKVSDVDKRIAGLEERTQTFAEIDARIQVLMTTSEQAHQKAEDLVAPDSDLQKSRKSVQNLSSQMLKAQASIDTLKQDQATLEEIQTELRKTQNGVKSTTDGTAVVKGELDQIRGTAGHLSQDYARLREASNEVREISVSATESIKELERKLVPLMQLQELSETTAEKLAGLNTMAEHVSQKTRALDIQRSTVERAVVEANRLNEMVWNMDVQINRLNEGVKEAQRSEETIDRIETLVEQTNATFEGVKKTRDDMARESARFKTDGGVLVDSMHASLERVALEKEQFEAFDLRLRMLQDAVKEAEGRMEAIGVTERNFSELPQKADVLNQSFQGLSVQADELAKKQAGLDILQDRLVQVEELAKRTALQQETLQQGRQELETLREDMHKLHESHVQVAQLSDKLAADRGVLEIFNARMTAFMQRTPKIDATLNVINEKLVLVDEGMKQTARLGELASELDAQIDRLSARTQVVDQVEARIDGLHTLTAEVDGKMAEQLARRSELDTLKSHCDSVFTQTLEAQQNIESVATRQGKLLPVTNRALSTLDARIEATQSRVKEVQQDEAVLREQETRLVECVEASRKLAGETSERLKQTQVLNDELTRAATIKDELISELARIQTRQRDAAASAEMTEDQIKRTETMYKQIEQRRGQFAFSEKKVTLVETKMAELSDKAGVLDQTIKGILERQAMVGAIKTEVDSVHEISARSRVDLQFVTDHRDEVAVVRSQINDLRTTVQETEEKIAVIEGRQKTVNEVHAKTNLISNLLKDVSVNLETLSEQKLIVDHLTEKLAGVDFTMQEAKNTLQTLKHERELAERIEQSIKNIRTKTAKADVPRKTA
jgi:chromosome segregation ATPase